MSATTRILEPLGARTASLPLTFGGPGADVRIPGLEVVGLVLEELGGQWFARPAGAGVTRNGIALNEAAALDAGDVIALGEAQLVAWPGERIEILHLAGNATVAPLRQVTLPGDEVVAGVREIFASDGVESGVAAAALPALRRHRWLMLGTVGVLVLAIAAVLFAMVPVPLQLQPEGTSAQASGFIHWQAGDRVFALPGRRVLTFTHPGYTSQTVTLAVSGALAKAQPLSITLAKLPGKLTVDTKGIAAELLVDGQPAGNLPGEIEVAPGLHDFIVRAPRRLDHVERLTIEGGGVRQQLAVDLQPATGWLVLDTDPSGGEVSVDGTRLGAAPQRVELDSGLRQLSITAPGRRKWNSEVAIIAGQTLDLGRIDLAAPPPPMPAVAATPAAETAAPEAIGSAPVVAPPAPPRTPSPARLQSELLGTLVLLPAGKYMQGSDRREQGRRGNEAQREVTLTRAFYLAANEVTNAQFHAFRAGHSSGIAMEKSLDLDLQAVSNLNWADAVEFCNWLSLKEGLPAAYERRDGRWQLVVPFNRGYRLPTEAEWEYAARYVDGRRWQRYAWGDQLPPPAGAANLGGQEALPAKPGPDVRLASSLPGYKDDHPVVAPVGSYARSAAGFNDLGGNVSEWIHDVYVSLPEAVAVTDPMGATADGAHAIRGANWRTTVIADLRPAWRERAAGPLQTVGFRVARFAEDAAP
jgi:formylglycine-generating enzyme required for sulfatase activity